MQYNKSFSKNIDRIKLKLKYIVGQVKLKY